MAFTKAQKSWLAYDPAISAYAMIVRTVVAPVFLVTVSQNILDESVCTEYWGYTCSIAGLIAGAISVFCGPLIDAKQKRVQTVALFTGLGVFSTLAYIPFIYCPAGSYTPYIVMLISFIGMLSFMGSNSFYDSLLVNITGKTERDKISSWGFALGYAGALVSFLLCLPLMFIADQKYFFPGAFLIAALWWAAGSLPLFKNVRESDSSKTLPAVKLADTLKFIWTQKKVTTVILSGK